MKHVAEIILGWDETMQVCMSGADPGRVTFPVDTETQCRIIP